MNTPLTKEQRDKLEERIALLHQGFLRIKEDPSDLNRLFEHIGTLSMTVEELIALVLIDDDRH